MAVNMRRLSRYRFIGYFLLLIIMLLAGCNSQTGGDVREPEAENELTYTVRETAIPNPDEALAGVLGEDGRIVELSLLLSEDKVYRLAQLWGKVDGLDLTQGYYIQILEPPYSAWQNYQVSSRYWNETVEYEAYSVRNICGVENGQVYCRVTCYEDKKNYLGRWNAEGTGELLGAISDAVQDNLDIAVNSEGGLYAYGACGQTGDSIILLNDRLEEKRQINVQGRILGILQNPQNGEMFWYGTNDKGAGVWRISDGASRLEEFRENTSFDLCAAFSDSGELYLTDKRKLWSCDENGKVLLLCDFFEKDYILNELYGMTPQADGTILMLAQYEGNYYMLSVEESVGVQQEKQQIVLATTRAGSEVSALKQSILRFNRRSEGYRVELMVPDADENTYDFADRVQLELAAGRGPDIFSEELIDPVNYAENGYIQSIEGMLTEEEGCWQAALECGTIDNVRYGVPYECRLRFATYSQKLTGGCSSWTLDEMMKAVRDSDAEILQSGLGGMQIVQYYGLYDNDNKAFIDWEKGESHLKETPFLEFLAFAKEYADKGDYNYEDTGAMLQEGKIAAEVPMGDLFKLETLCYLEECFQGEPAYIGFPGTQGNGIYVIADCLYVNSVTEKTEGCVEFLNFLLAEEQQNGMVTFEEDLRSEFYGASFLPVRFSALERSISLKRAEKKSSNFAEWSNGIEYNIYGLSDIQEEGFRFLIENARPGKWYALDIMDMVEEELQPYFEGQRTAQEAAKILDNRVQLYLDERK